MEFLLTLRRRGISDQSVLRAMDEVPRDRFVEAVLCAQRLRRSGPAHCLWTDHQPALRRSLHDRAACAAAASPRARGGDRLGLSGRRTVTAGREVVSVERYRTLADGARERLKSLGYDNVEIVVGDGFAGMPGRAPYDRIIVTAAAEAVPQTLLDQLAEDGIMILPLGSHEGSQHLIKLTKSQTGTRRENLIAVRFVPMLPGQAEEL